MSEVEVRIATPEDSPRAEAAAALIARAAVESDIAARDAALLHEKIETGHAALALADDELVGFGYFSEWQDGAFVSHSGLVVREDYQGIGLGRRLKEALLEASRRIWPDATTMSLTSSKAVEQLNLSLGFRLAPFDELTTDEEFWKGCLTCRNYDHIRDDVKTCCCFGMILPPGDAEA